MLKIIFTIAVLTSCVPSDGAKFPFGQPKYLDCQMRMGVDLTNKLSVTLGLAEFEAAAMGTRAVLRWHEDSDAAERYHVIAESTLKLFLQLPTSQRVYHIQSEAKMASMCAENATSDEMAKLYFEKIDSSLQSDAFAGQEYRRIKDKVQKEGGFLENANKGGRSVHFPTKVVNSSSAAAAVNLFYFKQNSLGRTLLLHWYFVFQYVFTKYYDRNSATPTDLWTPVAIVELSNDPSYGRQVQRIYNETVAEVAQKLYGMIRENSSKYDDFLPGISEESMRSIFFRSLNANFKKNSHVGVKFDSMKERMQLVATRINEFTVHLVPALPPSSEIVGIALLAEMAANSVGTHFFQINEDQNADEHSHLIGKWVLKLLLQLSTVDRALELLIDFSESSLTYTTLYAEKVNQLLENDPQVGPKYREIKRSTASTENEIAPTIDDHFDKTKIASSIFANETDAYRFVRSLLERNQLARKAFLHFLLIGEWMELGLTAPNAENNATTKALVELSKKPKYAEKVQQLYDEAMSVVIEKLDILMRDASTMKNLIDVASKIFFKSLSLIFQKGLNLETEFAITKMTYEAMMKSDGI